MFIPKNKMYIIVSAIDIALQDPDWRPEDIELLNQIADKAALVSNGDANFLEVDTVYATNPGRPDFCRHCGGKGKGDCPEC